MKHIKIDDKVEHPFLKSICNPHWTNYGQTMYSGVTINMAFCICSEGNFTSANFDNLRRVINLVFYHAMVFTRSSLS